MTDQASRINADATDGIGRTGIWLLVYLHLPGRERTPAGVLLWDPTGDNLHFAMRELSADENDEDIVIFWGEFGDLLESLAEDMGGIEAIEFLESSASHLIQVSTRTEVQIREPGSLLASLFNALIGSVSSATRFTEQELKTAQDKLPVLPSMGVQIIAALNDPRVDSREVERAISRDPVLTSHIIRLANSAALPISEPARSVGSAIQRIGFDATKLHVFALTVAKVYSSTRLRTLWDHSVKAAQIARHIAKRAGFSADEVALLALVHDIGRIAMFAIGDRFESEYMTLQRSGLTFAEIERKLCPLSHSEVGANLLKAWHFPEDMCEAVRYHHSPSETRSPLPSLLYLAESSLEENEDVYNTLEHSQALHRLGLENRGITDVRTTLDSDLQLLRSAA